jgi:hypothetical protein
MSVVLCNAGAAAAAAASVVVDPDNIFRRDHTHIPGEGQIRRT